MTFATTLLTAYWSIGFDPPPLSPADAERAAKLLQASRERGDAAAGARVFADPKHACVSCHRLGDAGGDVGPPLSEVGACLPAGQIVESLLWPERDLKPQFSASVLQLDDGAAVQGFIRKEDAVALTLWDPSARKESIVLKKRIEARRNGVSLMPKNLADGMTPTQLRDLVRFLMECKGAQGARMVAHLHRPATFTFTREPLQPAYWPSAKERVNRDRVYDFYGKQADWFRVQTEKPLLVQQYPGLDGGALGHWGNQNEDYWADNRANATIPDLTQAGVVRIGNRLVARAVCVRIGPQLSDTCCFDPDRMSYIAAWRGGFVRYSAVRHGVIDPLAPAGSPLDVSAESIVPAGERTGARYLGYYRTGDRLWFAFEANGKRYLDSPTIEDGKFVHERQLGEAPTELGAVAPESNPVYTVRGTVRVPGAYAIESIPLPTDNRWKALCFVGDHDFLPDGTGVVGMLHGDVWKVEGLDESLSAVRWRRFATGLHQPLGAVCDKSGIYVLGRDQITRLHDRNNDGVADFYECFSSAYETSPAGHDYICGLQRDAQGRFYTASGNQGLVRISADGRRAEVIATGLRNPDGLGLYPDGAVTTPASEGDWTAASMVCLARGGEHFGYRGLRSGQPPAPPLVYLPRGVDNSSGGQVYVPGDRWGPTQGRMVHLSFGAGAYFLMLRDDGGTVPQGAVWPMPGDFRSGAHRGKFNPRDGQLYVSGSSGWGTYTPDDGCFERVRYTGGPVTLPTKFAVHRNGVRLEFSAPLAHGVAGDPKSHFAQAWNYRYGPGYGSPEFSPSLPGVAGHDVWTISSATISADGRGLFLELPDLQPVSQLHLRLRLDDGPPRDLFATINAPADDFKNYPGYTPRDKTQREPPLVVDARNLKSAAPNPWKRKRKDARALTASAGPNLTFEPRSLRAKPGETLALTFVNPDVVPHNWVLAAPGSLSRLGDAANKLIAAPDAVQRHYIPDSKDVLTYTEIVYPGERTTIYFAAPAAKGRYPFLCTFPGHWMVMNGELTVE